MRIHHVLACFLTISINGQTIKQSNVQEESLSSIINDLAPIARITNGIAIQTGLSADPSKINDIVAEFLGIRSGDQVVKLKELKVENLAKDLDSFNSILEQLDSMRIQDPTMLKKMLGTLEGMKAHSAVLNGVNNPTKSFKAEVEAVNSDNQLFSAIRTIWKDDKWKSVLDIVEEIISTGWGKDGENNALTKMQSLSDSANSLIQTFSNYLNYETKFAKVLNISNVILKDVDVFAEQSTLYKDHIADFRSTSGNLKLLAEDVNSLNGILIKIPILSDLIAGITETLDLAADISQKSSSSRRLTAGFVDGVSDVKALMDDLRSDKVKGMLSEGKDLEKISGLLKPFSTLHGELHRVVTKWTLLSDPRAVNGSLVVRDLLEKVLKNGETVSKISNVPATLESVAKCLEDLKDPTVKFDPNLYNSAKGFLTQFSESLDLFKSTMESLKGFMSGDFATKFQGLLTEMKGFHSRTTPKEAAKLWEELRKGQNLKPVGEDLRKIHSLMEEGNKNLITDTIIQLSSLDEISNVLNSLKDTNLPGALDCLKTKPYKSDDIDKMISFGSDVQIIKDASDEMVLIRSYVKTIAELKGEVTGIDKVFKKTIRRRRALPNLQNAESISKDLGNGVQALLEYVKILNLQQHVKVAVNANVLLKAAIDKIPGAQSVWTNDNRKLMGEMITDLISLDKKVGAIPKTNISTHWMVFEEAGKVKGVEIDAKVFGDVIAPGVRIGRSKAIQKSENDFIQLGTLNLNFAQHHVNLKAAFLTMGPLQQFFDDFFGNNQPVTIPTVVTTTEEPKPSLSWVYFVGGGAVGLGAIAGVGFFYRRRSNEKDAVKMRRFNPERYWVYHNPTCNPSDTNWIPIACASGKPEVIRKLIDQGQNVNTYHNGYSCLHHAVAITDANIIDMLIKAGFDQTLRDRDGRTAEEFLIFRYDEWKKENKNNETNKDYERAVDCLKKWKDVKQFESYIPPLPSPDTFSICVHDDLIVDFSYQYGSMVYQEGSTTRTHNAVKCDENGVFDIDKLCITKEKDRDGEVHEKIDREKRRKLVNLVFDFALLVNVKWIEEILRIGSKAFFLDYDKYRVTKVKYAGEIYDSVDLWRKWACNRAVPALQNCLIYFHCAENTKPETLIGKSLGAAVADKCSDAIEYASSKSRPEPYWFKDLKPTFFIAVDGPESDDWMMNMEAVKTQNTSFTEEGYYKWLLSRTGVGKGELDEEEQEKKRMQLKGYEQWKEKQMDKVLDEEDKVADKRKKGDKKGDKNTKSQSTGSLKTSETGKSINFSTAI